MELQEAIVSIDYIEPALERLGIKKTEFDECLEAVKLAFGEKTTEWKNVPIVLGLYPVSFNNLQENPVWRILYGRVGGLGSIADMTRLGKYILSWPKDSIAIYSRLKDRPEDYIGVLFELEVHFQFIKSGWCLSEALEPGGIDFTFERDGKRVFVEATHLGASSVQDQERRIMWKTFGHSSSTPAKEPRRVKVIIDHNFLRDADDHSLDAIAESIVKGENGFIQGKWDAPGGKWSIVSNVLPYGEKGSVEFSWYCRSETQVAIYEAEVRLKSKLQEKASQLRKNRPSIAAVDIRTVMPHPGSWGNNTNFPVCSQFMCRLLDAAKKFMKDEETVAGILLWCPKASYGDPLHRWMDDDVIFVPSPRLDRAQKYFDLFPFAHQLEELEWYTDK